MAYSKKYKPIQGGGSLIVAYQIANKKVIFVGGGSVAAQRIVSLKMADIHVTVICPESVYGSDLDHVDMCLTALDDHEESLRIGQLCRERRIPVNVADVPPLCDFYFMSQHRDGPLHLAVSTNGQGPKLVNMIRVKAAKSLRPNMCSVIERMGRLRAKVKEWEPSMKNSGKRMTWVTLLCEKRGLDSIAKLNEVDEEQEAAVFEEFRKHFLIDSVSPVENILSRKAL
ncbi:Bifunctional dehydrogenase and ferrochelatase [Rhizopus azygosporus]|uniref:precorrin-2 dehydrogenase n=1 Tax=Rhizopus azygosporus TaxID=86630 RepID=A0A367KDV1_RHIAZ|nr:Bifunctional dehydrogenase and ferrochelatase [Rhizopus azygosporus]